jgi:hypothetical protein
LVHADISPALDRVDRPTNLIGGLRGRVPGRFHLGHDSADLHGLKAVHLGEHLLASGAVQIEVARDI